MRPGRVTAARQQRPGARTRRRGRGDRGRQRRHGLGEREDRLRARGPRRRPSTRREARTRDGTTSGHPSRGHPRLCDGTRAVLAVGRCNASALTHGRFRIPAGVPRFLDSVAGCLSTGRAARTASPAPPRGQRRGRAGLVVCGDCRNVFAPQRDGGVALLLPDHVLVNAVCGRFAIVLRGFFVTFGKAPSDLSFQLERDQFSWPAPSLLGPPHASAPLCSVPRNAVARGHLAVASGAAPRARSTRWCPTWCSWRSARPVGAAGRIRVPCALSRGAIHRDRPPVGARDVVRRPCGATQPLDSSPGRARPGARQTRHLRPSPRRGGHDSAPRAGTA